MVGMALLFNPLVPVGLSRDTWVILDLAAAVVFGLTVPKLGPRPEEGLE